jgi:hypothetical protein
VCPPLHHHPQHCWRPCGIVVSFSSQQPDTDVRVWLLHWVLSLESLYCICTQGWAFSLFHWFPVSFNSLIRIRRQIRGQLSGLGGVHCRQSTPTPAMPCPMIAGASLSLPQRLSAYPAHIRVRVHCPPVAINWALQCGVVVVLLRPAQYLRTVGRQNKQKSDGTGGRISASTVY